MNKIVLDASALLAVLAQEHGADQLTPELLSHAVSSTVNLAEAHGKLVHRGMKPEEAWEAAFSPVREVVPFTSQHARILSKPARLVCRRGTEPVWHSAWF